MSASKSGRCMCGAVSFTAQNVPDRFGACHCDMCKRWSGNVFNGVPVAIADMEIAGENRIRLIRSSAWAERAFCSECGSPLWYRMTEGDQAANRNLAVGLFDSTEGMTLGFEFYVDRKTSAHEMPEDRNQYTEAETLALFAPEEDQRAEGDSQ